MYIFFFVVILLIPLTMIAIGMRWKNHSPKKVNWIYGYRTSRSMSSQEAWMFAHKFFGRLWFGTGIATAIVTVILMILFRSSNDDTMGWMVTIWVLIQCVILIIPIFPTEIALKKNFDQNGIRKEK